VWSPTNHPRSDPKNPKSLSEKKAAPMAHMAEMYLELQAAGAEIARLRAALEFIVSQENLTFAECSLAEEIIGRAKAALQPQ
jgi:hypothetical protein